jgi:peptidoglycan LD-endopeptidase CwlK
MHLNISECVACAAKLKQVHPDLCRWVGILRSTHPDAHVSCGYRGEAEQEADFAKGASRAHYGQSAHNTTPATAVDIFRLTLTGASFDKVWFETVMAPIARGAGLVWGGDWHSIKDMPHVELNGFKPFKV